MKRLLSLEECKGIQLEILDEIDSFCLSQGLRYSLAYGTLLGAVRHKGYIPWDDDIDLIMPRPDYERFIATFMSDKNVLLDLNRSNVCIEAFVKVSRKGTLMRDIELGRELWGVNVDVFPVDGFPDDPDAHLKDLDSLNSWVPKLCLFYKVVGSGKAKWFLKYLFKRIRYSYTGTCASLKMELTRKLMEYPFICSPLAGSYLGGDGLKEIMPREWFETFTTLCFEGKVYPALLHYDDYLNHLFGDYMELPPEEDRVTHHLYDSFILE